MAYSAKKIIIIIGAGMAILVIALVIFLFLPIFDQGQIQTNETIREPILVAPAFPPKIIGDKKFYKNILLRFSILFPGNLTVKEYDEGRGSLMVFEDEEGKKGFQIFAVPYEGEEVSKERFKMDVPSGVMKNPVDIVIDGVPAKAFFSSNALVGETREVWFIKNGFLYEVTTYKELDEWLAEVMKTWRFL